MKDIKRICLQISERLSNLPYDSGDLSDIGNEIGIIIGKHFGDDIGFDMESFRAGLRHGISLASIPELPGAKVIDSRNTRTISFHTFADVLKGDYLAPEDALEIDPDPLLVEYHGIASSLWTEFDGNKEEFSDKQQWHYIMSDMEQNIFLLKRLHERGLIKDGSKMADCGIGLGTALYDFFLQSRQLGLGFEFFGIEKHAPYMEFLKNNLLERWEGKLFLIEGGIEDQSYGEYDIIYSFTPFRDLDMLRSFYEKVAADMKPGSIFIENKCGGLGMRNMLDEISGLEKIEIDGIFVFKKV